MVSHLPLCLLNEDDIETLSSSEGFGILRRHLAEHYQNEYDSLHLLVCTQLTTGIDHSFCYRHISANAETKDRWLIIRDIIHALLVPVVELFDKATNVAARATHATRIEDLEFAYSGDARSAFIWLQCFLSTQREQDWCATRGCPACVIDHSLDSEFNVRLLYAACLLSEAHFPFTMEGPSLPRFTFFLESLETAIADDELFGDKFFEMIQPKAIATRDGIEELIHQCFEIEGLLSQPASPLCDADSTSQPGPVLLAIGSKPMTKLKRSKIAKRQMKLKAEADYWIEEILTKCWDHLHPTINDSTLIDDAHTLDAAITSCGIVRVTEVAPA